MEALLAHPFTGVIMCIAAFGAGLWLRHKTGSAFANPLLVGTVVLVVALRLLPVSMADFRNGGSIITLFILPATTVLALHIHRAWDVLRANALPIVGSCLAGSVVSIASVYGLCRLFGVNAALTASVVPKSVTTAISIELAEKTGGMAAIAVSAVILTGMVCVVAAPLIIKAFSLKDEVANGLAFGVSGHAIGTSKALEYGETEAAMAGMALGLSGVVTSVLYAFHPLFL